MTQPRSQLISTDAPGTYHCVQRCVRRAFLCGVDRHSGASFEHRKAWIEQRLHLVAECFAVAIHAYAVMSNHLHIVLHLDPNATRIWSDAEIAERWIRLFPPREDSDIARKAKMLHAQADPARLAVLRQRLGDLSWLMKCFAEPIARRANAEDGCKGRFWEGRFKAQVLCDERAVLAAMTYVDLNPIRTGITQSVQHSDHTSIAARLRSPEFQLEEPLGPVAGCLAMCLPIRTGDYAQLVEWTGRQIHPGKRGVIAAAVPSMLTRLHSSPHQWGARVKAFGSGYWRVVGDAQALIEMAERIGQRWLKGIGTAIALADA